jgi:hypothetical protein
MSKSALLAFAAVCALAAPVIARDDDSQRLLEEKYRHFSDRSMQLETSDVVGKLCGIYLPQADDLALFEFRKSPASIFDNNASGTTVLARASLLISANKNSFTELLDAAASAYRSQRLAIGVALAVATASCHPLEASESNVMASIVSSANQEVLMGYAAYKAGVPTTVILGEETPVIRASTN